MTAPVRIFTPEYYTRMRELERGSWWNAAMRDIAALLLADARLPTEGTLLDIGCGTGDTMLWWSSVRPRWQRVGLDVAPDGLAAARHAGAGTLLHASALDLPVEDDSVDLAISLDVLQHLPLDGGDARCLQEVKRVLRPGGWFLLRTNAQAFPGTRPDPENDFQAYEPHVLRRRLEAAGLQVLRLSRVNALLGLAEVPRRLRARRDVGSGYTGILAGQGGGGSDTLKRRWLRLEGRAVRAGWRLPFGRSIVALCRR
jgi:SAM-dependent methyltransferase